MLHTLFRIRMQVRAQSVDILPSLSGSHFAQCEKEVDSAGLFREIKNC